MMVMLENGVIPIVNENDTISVTELMFTEDVYKRQVVDMATFISSSSPGFMSKVAMMRFPFSVSAMGRYRRCV